MNMRAIARLTGVLLATGAAAEPLNYDSCENIQDSREYAHCIATLGAGGAAGKKTATPPAPAEPAATPQPQAAAPEKEAPAPKVAVKTRGGRVVFRAAARGGGRMRAAINPRAQKKPAHAAAKPAPRRGKWRH
jgi:hypothetical protein